MDAATNAATLAPDGQSTDNRIFVIASSNEWVHIYPDVPTMLDCKDSAAAAPGPLEFFDIHGRRLAPVFTNDWTLEGLRAGADAPDPAAVQARLGAVIDRIRTTVEDRLARASLQPGTAEEALGHLPDLGGRSLAECFDLLKTQFGDGSPAGAGKLGLMHDGSFWHNFWCH